MTKTQATDEDPELAELRQAQVLWQSGALTEDEYIDRAIAIFRRDVDALLTDEEREDITRGLRFGCHTSPEMRTRLGLEPFPDS